MQLAEYNKDGKFESFLEFDNFFISANWIIVDIKSEYPDATFACGFADNLFKKDETDPLNRFNGLFNGRTYGEGRFVLIEKDEHDIKQIERIFPDFKDISYERGKPIFDGRKNRCEFLLGNLHENPELYEKIKND